MAVLRHRVRVQPAGSPGLVQGAAPVVPGPNPNIDTIRETAGIMARHAAQYASALTDANIEEATLLARTAAMRINESGGLDIPPNAAARLGSLAQRAYDRTIDERVADEIATELRRISSEQQNAHLYDPEGYNQGFEEAIGTFMDGFRGTRHEQVAAQAAAGVQVQGSAEVGHRTATFNMESYRSRIPEMSETYTARMREQITLGDDAAATAVLQEHAAWLTNLPTGVITDGQRLEMLEAARLEMGLQLMTRDLDLANASSGELLGVIERLHTMSREGGTEIDYFNREDGTPDRALTRQAESYVQGLLQQAYAREGDQVDEARQAAREADIALGIAQPSAENMAALDNILGRTLGLSGEGGQLRPMTHTDWATMDEATAARAVASFKTAGMIPRSLQQYLTGLQNSRDPARLAQAFRTLDAMQRQANLEGQTIDFSSHMPDDVLAIYTAAGDFLDPTARTAEGVQDVIDRVGDSLLEPMTDDRLATTLNLRPGSRGRVTDEDAREVWESEVIRGVFGTEDVPQAFRDQAVRMATVVLGQTHDGAEAIDYVRQSMADRLPASRSMSPSGETRSAYAPERWYASSPDGIAEWLQQQGRNAAGGVLETVEAGVEGQLPSTGASGSFVLMPFELMDLMGLTFDFGADAVNASPFELMAHEQIAEQIMQLRPAGLASDLRAEAFEGAGDESVEIARPVLIPGEDYYLQGDPAGGFPPVYRVWMRGENGNFVPLPEVLDVREQFSRFQEVDTLLRGIRTEQGDTLADALWDPNRQGAIFSRIGDIHAVLDIDDQARRNAAMVQLMNEIATGERVVDGEARGPGPITE